MKKTTYTSFEQIDRELKKLSLQRQIALEELKYTKHSLKEDLAPYQWANTAIDAIKKYGVLYLIKRILK